MPLKKITILFLLFSSLSYGQNWLYDMEIAKEMAKDKNQNIVLVFTGSDWCPPCIRLEKNILSTPEFINYSNDNIVLVRADFPRKKKNKLSDEQMKKNQDLADRYNKRMRFPRILVLDKKGNILGKEGYKRKAPITHYISFINSLKI